MQLTIRAKQSILVACTLALLMGSLYLPVDESRKIFLQAFLLMGFAGTLLGLGLTFVWNSSGGFVVNAESRLGQAILILTGGNGGDKISSCGLAASTMVLFLAPGFLMLFTGIPLVELLLYGASETMQVFVAFNRGWTGAILFLLVLLLCWVSYICLLSARWAAYAENWFFLTILLGIAILPAWLAHVGGMNWLWSFLVEIGIYVATIVIVVTIDWLGSFIPQRSKDTSESPEDEHTWYEAICPTIPVSSTSHPVNQASTARRIFVATLLSWTVGVCILYLFCTIPIIENAWVQYERDGYKIQGYRFTRYTNGGVERWRTQGDRAFLYRRWRTVADFNADTKLNIPQSPHKQFDERVPIDENDKTLSTWTYGSREDQAFQERWKAAKHAADNQSPWSRRWRWGP